MNVNLNINGNDDDENVNVIENRNGNDNVNVNLNINGNDDDEIMDINMNDIEGDRIEDEHENQRQSVSEKGKKNDGNGSEIDEDEEKRIIDETPINPLFNHRAQSVPQLYPHQSPLLSPRAESQPRTFSTEPPIDNNTNGRKRKREESKARSVGILISSISPSIRSPSNPSTETRRRGSWKATTTQIEPRIMTSQTTKKRKLNHNQRKVSNAFSQSVSIIYFFLPNNFFF